MKKLLFIIFISLTNILFSQTYIHPTTSIQGQYVGDCLVNTCSGTYLDPGGNNSYPNGVNNIYRVFCPNIAEQCVQVTFNSFSMEGMINPIGPNPLDCYYDFLTIGNGPSQNSPIIYQTPPNSPNSTSGRICGFPALPFTYTADNPSGCLTMRFRSDASVISSGWNATINCVPCPTIGNGPNGSDPNDCVNAIPVCSDGVINGNSTGPGIVSEGCNGNTCPVGGENHTQWFLINIGQGGTLNWNINPLNLGDDYDFALYGPNVTCGSLGNPIICSDAATTGSTGSSVSAVDSIENVNGNGFVSQINVNAGETYYLVIDEWSPNSGGGYNLTWGGTAVLDCSSILNVHLIYFGAQYNLINKNVDITWATQSEYKNSHFIIEKSIDGINWIELETIESKGNYIGRKEYKINDNNPVPNGFTYYRLKWISLNGKVEYSKISVLALDDPSLNGILIYPNPTKDFINIKNYYNTNPLNIQLFNSLGQCLLDIKEEKNEIILNLSSFSAGFYYLIINNKKYKINKI